MLSVVPWDGVRCCGADVELAVGSVTARRMTGRDLVSCPLGNAGMVTRGSRGARQSNGVAYFCHVGFSPGIGVVESRDWAQVFGPLLRGCNECFVALVKFIRAFGPRRFHQGNNYTYRIL